MPPSSADLNLSMCRYLPRRTPSMSWTPTLTWLRPRSLTILSASEAVLTWRGSIPSPGAKAAATVNRSHMRCNSSGKPPMVRCGGNGPEDGPHERSRAPGHSDRSPRGRRWRAFHLFALGAGLLAVALSSIETLPASVELLLEGEIGRASC